LRSTAYDGCFDIPTLDEIIELLATQPGVGGRLIGLVPELKHSSYFAGLGLPMEDRLLACLAAHAYTCRAPVEIQSFEIGNLRYLRGRLGASHRNVRLLQLLGEPQAQPWDATLAGHLTNYAQMMTPNGLRDIAGYADAVGPWHRDVVPLIADQAPGPPTALVADAHAAGLQVHAYTFRPENFFLPRSLWSGDDPETINVAGSISEIRACLDAGIDAFFTDSPAIGRQAVDLR
jgi:glycerophosphoryl diester phosphodiesterase